MKTYSESQGKSVFDWRLALAVNATEINWSALEFRSKDWTTCACGNQCSIIQRHDSGEPMDSILSKLGGDSGFHGAIRNRDAKLALHYLDLIEAHSAHLISKALPEAIRRLNEKKVGIKVRHDRELKELKDRHLLEASTLKKEIAAFNKNFPGSV